MRSQETRLRRKWSQIPCNLVNFVLVNQKSEVRWGQQQGEEKTRQKKKGVKSEKPQRRGKEVRGDGISYHQHGFNDVQQMSDRLSLCAGAAVPARAQQ